MNEMHDTIQILIAAVATVLIMGTFAWCDVKEREIRTASDLEHIKLGHCEGPWGRWEVCKQVQP